MRKRACPYCNLKFRPSRYHRDQKVCSSVECQRHRRTEYHRQKVAADPAYREQCRDSRTKWREKNPGYMKHYRAQCRAKGHSGDKRTHVLNQLRRLTDLVKNNAVFDLQSLAASVWLVCPEGLLNEKNNLTSANVIILQGAVRSTLYRTRLKRTSL